MRLLAALPHYPPHSRVGAWLATHQLLAHMVARGHVVDVTTTLGLPGDYEHEGVRVHPRVPPRTLMPTADILLSHLGGELTVGDRAKRYGLPHVVSAHGLDPLNQARLGRLRPDLLIANSQSLLDEFAKPGPATVLHPTVRPEQFRTDRGDHVTLVNVTPRKGSATFYALADRLPQMRFLGVRGGYGPPDLRRHPNVAIVGTTPDMRTVYSRTRVLLMPSLVETYGMVGIEAMCSGIPVIAHPTPGLVESLGDAGIFVDRDDVAGWARALTDLDDPATYAAASERALARVAQLDPTSDLDRVADLIESLAEGADRAAVV